jgi:intracellular sulfur oxidation DsrE/DsrF family protein
MPTDAEEGEMKNPLKEPISEEYLNALVDGELTADEREQAYRRIEEDAEFKARACETRTLKEMIKGVYGDLPPAPSVAKSARGLTWWPQAIAAALVLLVGLGGGWVARGELDKAPQVDRLAGLPMGYQPISLATQVDPGKVLLHLDSNEPARLEAALDLAERLLAAGRAGARVEVLVNNYGLNLLRQDTSPYRERIERLTDQHANLAFVACGQTLARLKREGVRVVLVPEASVTTSAIGEILGHMRQGWVYVKV